MGTKLLLFLYIIFSNLCIIIVTPFALRIINTRRTCAARVTVIVLYVCMNVCMCVCVSVHPHMGLKGYHCIKHQICGNIKMAFFFKLYYSKVRAFFTLPQQGRPSLVDAYSACNVSYILRYMFAYA